MELRKVKAWDEDRSAFVRAKLTETESSNIVDERGFDLVWWTGLRDKNGAEIYEGDIVFLEPYLKRSPAKVSFKGGSFGLEWDGMFSPMQLTQPDTMEVIGNIYESPELLEGSK